MLARIAAFEMRYQIRSPLFIFCFSLFFLLTFFSVASTQVQIGAAGNVHVNSPYAILQTLGTMSVFALFIVTAFVASIVLRDHETGFAPILYTTRMRKSDYLVGRFIGAITVALLLLASVPLAMLIGSAMPWLDPQKVGPLVVTHYLYALFLFGLPVLLVAGAGLFALVTVTRSMMWCYVGLVAFLVGYLTTMTMLRDPAYDHLTALLDPFGLGALDVVSKYWTAEERNTRLPALTGLLLENRLLWLGIAAVLFATAYGLFHFEARGSSVQRAQAKGAEAPVPAAVPVAARQAHVPDGGTGVAFARLMRFEMRNVFVSPAFAILLLLGVLNSVGGLVGIVSDTYTDYLPVTRAVVGVLQGAYAIFPLIIAIYYTGELVWRERERRIHEIVDACPAPNWTILLPKVVAVSLVLIATVIAGVLTGMVFQLAHGYSTLEVPHYLLWFVVPEAIYACQIAVLSICVQTLLPNKYFGYGVMIVYIVVSATLASFGYEHGLYRYGYMGSVPLSDFNGMDRFWIARAWYQLYWSAFAAILLVASLLLLRRGNESRLTPRLALGWQQLRGAPAAVITAAGAVFLGSGAYIYYNTVILNDYRHRTDVAEERFAADYEKALLPYEKVPQPMITTVKLAVQLYPSQVRADTTGSYVIENRTTAPIPVLHVRWDPRLAMKTLDVGPAALEKDFGAMHYRIYRLATPIAPGEQRTVSFATRLEERGFPNRSPLHRIVRNGTFLNNMEIAPMIGMGRDLLLTDRNKRRRQHLPPDLRPARLEDTAANFLPLFRHDSDWVNAEITVTTDADQTPLAPGYTVSDETRNGRRTIVTRTEAPIAHFFSIQSARYAIARDVWTGHDGKKVDLAVYYLPGHPYNVPRILTAMKASLDVYSERFSPYQFRQARILEFPAYERFAQSFANTIPFSEGIGFIQKYDEKTADSSSIDLVTFVTAHELGHQWWGHQVAGADKQGATMLVETFAQYSSMLVMEKMYGHDQIRKFLKTNLDDYLRNRGTEVVEELPLNRVENQAYIHYRKGAVVMYWLKEALGEDVLDRALRRLLSTYAFKGAPYPSTAEFLAFLKEEAGPGHDALIDDLFARITLYDMKAHDATAHKRPDGRYEVRFSVDGRKLYADSMGKEKEVPLDEPFDVGVFTVEPGKKGYGSSSVLTIERVAVKSGTHTITLVADKLPKVAGIDPFNERIDRNSDDNLTPVTLEETTAPAAPGQPAL